MGEFEPTIIAFVCNWCTYTAADLAGTSRLTYPHNVRLIRMMCTGMVDPKYVIKALLEGADAVLISGCHPGDCHYIEGNTKAMRRVRLLRRMLKQMGIDEKRFRLEWISASEGEKVKSVINEIVEEVRALGPLGLPKRFSKWDQELEDSPLRGNDKKDGNDTQVTSNG